MKYRDLDLKKIRTEMDLDFAHYTYKPGMCSCCYGPKDLPARYWKDNVVQSNKDYEDIQYLLFKNADNGGGHVRADDEIGNDYIEWGFPIDKLDGVCEKLKEQLGDAYDVEKPENEFICIHIKKKY